MSDLIKEPIAVFAYSFPHKKTYDVLNFLFVQGFRNVSVIAAPKVSLSFETGFDFEKLKSELPDTSCKTLCQTYGYRYLETHHKNKNEIESFLQKTKCTDIGLIAGARILPSNIINLFNTGIINLHPGKIPETSGLDSFYWMVKNTAEPVVTAHFINSKVDAGELIFFQPVGLHETDTPTTLNYKLYNAQLAALKRILNLLKFTRKFSTSSIVRPQKNQPMSSWEKKETLNDYEEWKMEQIKLQNATAKVFNACEKNNIEEMDKVLANTDLRIIEYKNKFGRTPLAVAAYNHSIDCVVRLLELGANVNAVNDKGTSILMYAKTKLVQGNKRDNGIIKLLLNAGANKYHRDVFGKTVFDYVKDTQALSLGLK